LTSLYHCLFHRFFEQISRCDAGKSSPNNNHIDLEILSQYLKVGTPILVHDFLNTENEAGKIGVKRAALEWQAAGHGRFMGCAGCCALYVTVAAPK